MMVKASQFLCDSPQMSLKAGLPSACFPCRLTLVVSWIRGFWFWLSENLLLQERLPFVNFFFASLLPHLSFFTSW